MIAAEQVEATHAAGEKASAGVGQISPAGRCACAGESVKVAQLRLPVEMRAFWWATLIGVLLAVVIGWLKYRVGMSIYNWDPLSDLLFGDLMEYRAHYSLLHTSGFFFSSAAYPFQYPMWNPVAYPPFAVAVMAPLYAFRVPELLYLVVSVVWVIVGAVWAARRLMHAGIAALPAIAFPVTIALASFPIVRMIHEGNIELVVWMFTALGVWSFWRGKNDAAAVLWGLAAAMKLFPLVLLGMLLPRKKWRAFAEGIAAFVLATLWATWWVGPTIGVAWRGSMQNVFGYQGQRMGEWTLRELVANHSAINLAKMVAMMTRFPLDHLTLPYFALGAAILAWAFFGRLWKMPEANQLLALSVFMVTFPSISYYHTLVHLYAPLAVLFGVSLEAARRGVIVQGLKKTILLFVPLSLAFTVMTFPQVILFSGLIQAVVLIVLFGCAVTYRFEVKKDETPVQRSIA
ncbi:MAG TPA: glycosyltransferase family 87 protein [Acidobacteriaceae bacterium]|nr:glycosyltransferase family 87 protein [Acidobacteriaceae bacterium]